jgi:hypothetical protein
MINSVEPLEPMTTNHFPTKEERALLKAELKAEKAAQQQKDLEANLAAATAELPWTILSLMAKARELGVEPILDRITHSGYGEAIVPDRFVLTIDTLRLMGDACVNSLGRVLSHNKN